MSDIIFLRAWYAIKPHRFYNPVTNLLDLPSAEGESTGWKGMRLTGQVRAEEGIETPSQKDSAYRKIERQNRNFNPLRVPKKLAGDLPFKSQIAAMKPQRKQSYMQKRAVVVMGEEKKARRLMEQVLALRNEKTEKRRAAQEKRKDPYRARVKENEEKRRAREKKETAEFWSREGKKRKRQEGGGGEGGNGGGKKRR